LREECRLRLFENKMLRRIYGPRRHTVTGEWRRLHNKELYVLYSSPISGDHIMETKMGKASSTYGGQIGSYRGLVGKPEGRRPLGRPRHRNIKMDF
jgi:hypothetical protein